jgi:regulator of telomere elongation helicase 1
MPTYTLRCAPRLGSPVSRGARPPPRARPRAAHPPPPTRRRRSPAAANLPPPNSGVEVDFPHEAYPVQLDYMAAVVRALQTGQNALLESPTGTGKTLCLLCAALGWRESLKAGAAAAAAAAAAPPLDMPLAPGGAPPPSLAAALRSDVAALHAERAAEGKGLPAIVYASRTHAQLKQVMGELRATRYRPRTAVLHARHQSCLHPAVKTLPAGAANQACRGLVGRRGCKWHFGVERFMATSAGADANGGVMDIEELSAFGQARGLCPYYLSRAFAATAELVFMPYQYLVDPATRGGLGIKWEGAVLIFDEAHNVEGVCADASSADVPPALLAGAVEEAGTAAELATARAESAPPGADAAGRDGAAEGLQLAADLRALRLVLQRLERDIAALAAEKRVAPGRGFTAPGAFLFELLGRLALTPATWPAMGAVMEAGAALLAADAAEAGRRAGARPAAHRLSALRDALALAFSTADTAAPDGEPLHAGFRVHLHVEAPRGGGGRGGGRGGGAFGGRGGGRGSAGGGFAGFSGAANTAAPPGPPTLSYWCFAPGQAMAALAAVRVRCLVLTSGTLSPLGSFAAELGVPFPIRLENPHVVPRAQVWVGVLGTGPSGRPLNSSFATRSAEEYKQELGDAVVAIAAAVPDGLLVFFASYGLMYDALEAWKRPPSRGGAPAWERLAAHKAAVVEPRDPAAFPAAAADFRAKLDSPAYRGAALFAVCRGKASEGLDFADRAGRAVVVTGIPFPMKVDPKVVIKQEVLNEAARRGRGPAKRPAAGGGGAPAGFATAFGAGGLPVAPYATAATAAPAPAPLVSAAFEFAAADAAEPPLTGDAWYVQQAARAVNQAMGRVIRHAGDYGAVILLDERFAQPRQLRTLSRWLRDSVAVQPGFAAAEASLRGFFAAQGARVRREGAAGAAAAAEAAVAAGPPGGPAGSGTFSAAARGAGAGGAGTAGSGLLAHALPAAVDMVGLAELAVGRIERAGGGAVEPPRTRASIDELLAGGAAGLAARRAGGGAAAASAPPPGERLKPWERAAFAAPAPRLGAPAGGGARAAPPPGAAPGPATVVADFVGPPHLLAAHQERQRRQAADARAAAAAAPTPCSAAPPLAAVPAPASAPAAAPPIAAPIAAPLAAPAAAPPTAPPAADPKAAMARLRAELPREAFRVVEGALRAYAASSDIAALVDAVGPELAAPGRQELLAAFRGLVPAGGAAAGPRARLDAVAAAARGLRSALPAGAWAALDAALRARALGGSPAALVDAAAPELAGPARREQLAVFKRLIPPELHARLDARCAAAAAAAAPRAPPPAPGARAPPARGGVVPARGALLPAPAPVPRPAARPAPAAAARAGAAARPAAAAKPAQPCAACGRSPMEAPHRAACCGRVACFGCGIREAAAARCGGCGGKLQKKMLRKEHFV